jgi:hypothetical protein
MRIKYREHEYCALIFPKALGQWFEAVNKIINNVWHRGIFQEAEESRNHENRSDNSELLKSLAFADGTGAGAITHICFPGDQICKKRTPAPPFRTPPCSGIESVELA